MAPLSPRAFFSPAAERNKAPILAVLERVLPRSGLVLEIASGSGQHAAHFARAMPDLTWQPSEPHAPSRAAMHQAVVEAELPNLRLPLDLDVMAIPWPLDRADAVVCINMIHIAPWAATAALLEGCSGVLGRDSPLVLYGPYRRAGYVTAPSNEAFDESLRARDPEWGLRSLEDVSRLALNAGFRFEESVDLPANNICVIFRRN